MKVRYSEIFYSFQGEAELAGTPTTWLRFFGCNLECNGFGQDNPADTTTHELPYKDFDTSNIIAVEQLPVWEFGCDSSYSWSMKYKHLAQDATPEVAADKLEALLPHGKFTHPETGQENMLAFTGGEPMLQQKQMKAIVNEFLIRGNPPKIITVETNGTKKLGGDLKNFINDYLSEMGIRWHWAISPKILNTSGETGAVDVDMFMSYIDGTHGTGCLKFVCNGSDASWEEIERYVKEVIVYCNRAEITVPDIWIMPVGATKEEQETVADIVNESMRRGYKVATRNHAYVYGNQIGT
jgi:organic radical activating enzyme